jgi:hypothetical protein
MSVCTGCTRAIFSNILENIALVQAHCISAVQCSAVQCRAVQCSAVQCSAVQCSAVQCSAVQCSAVQCSAALPSPVQYITSALGESGFAPWPPICAVQCKELQCSALQVQGPLAYHESSLLRAPGALGAGIGATALHCTALHCTALLRH